VPLAYEPQTYWDKRARKYAKIEDGLKAVCCIGADDYNRYMDFLQKKAIFSTVKMPTRSRVLDVGCGVGRISFEFAARGIEVYGLDISKEMVEVAKAKSRDVEFLVMDSGRLGFRKNLFDLAIAVTVLQHVTKEETMRAAIQEMIRVVKPTGKVAIMEHIARKEKPPVFHMAFRTKKQWVRLFERERAVLVQERAVDLAPFKRWVMSLGKVYLRVKGEISDGKLASHLIGEDEVLGRRGPTTRKAYEILMKIALTISRPFDLYLSRIQTFNNFAAQILLVFQKCHD